MMMKKLLLAFGTFTFYIGSTTALADQGAINDIDDAGRRLDINVL